MGIQQNNAIAQMAPARWIMEDASRGRGREKGWEKKGGTSEGWLFYVSVIRFITTGGRRMVFEQTTMGLRRG